MLSIFLGPDEFTKNMQLQTLADKQKAKVVFITQPESLALGELLGQDLFAAKKLFVLKEAVKLIDESSLLQLINSANTVILTEEKIDKRSSFNKSLLSNKSVTVKHFALPHGQDLNKWLINRVNELGGKISAAGAEVLAINLGRDQAKETKFGGKVVDVQEVYTLLDAENEIAKLLAYAAGAEISPQMVKDLVPAQKEADVFDLTNAIGENNRARAYELMEIFLQNETAADEKGKIIQLNAILCEQFRNVAIVQDFSASAIPESQILEKTGWKSGRLFIIKKLAGKFSSKKVLEVLNKLSLLDEELKTSSTPPRVLLDLIFAQL
jgi:DNA polymerase III delta subunit